MPRKPAPAKPAAADDLDRRLADAVERLGHGLRALAQQSARAEGLTPLQQNVLLMLRRPAGRHEVGTLAAEVDVSVPTMSDAVAALDRKGLIERAVARDARRRRLSLTAEGRRVASRLEEWDSALLRALSAQDEGRKAVALDVVLGVIGSLAADGTIAASRACSTWRSGVQPGAVGSVRNAAES